MFLQKNLFAKFLFAEFLFAEIVKFAHLPKKLLAEFGNGVCFLSLFSCHRHLCKRYGTIVHQCLIEAVTKDISLHAKTNSLGGEACKTRKRNHLQMFV
jgi:hypothetical protein